MVAVRDEAGRVAYLAVSDLAGKKPSDKVAEALKEALDIETGEKTHL